MRYFSRKSEPILNKTEIKVLVGVVVGVVVMGE
jgi:hypothetical protein